MTFAENLNRLCKEQNTYLTTVLKGLGFSSSKVTAINRGQIPNNEADLKAIAAALHCSVIDLFWDDEPMTEPQDEDEQDILDMFRTLSRREKHEFMSMVYEFGRRKELEGDKPDHTAEQGHSDNVAI